MTSDDAKVTGLINRAAVVSPLVFAAPAREVSLRGSSSNLNVSGGSMLNIITSLFEGLAEAGFGSPFNGNT